MFNPFKLFALELLFPPDPLELLHTCALQPELDEGYSMLMDSGSPIPLFNEFPLLLLIVNMWLD